MSYTFFLLLLTLVHSTFSSLAPTDRAALESIKDSLTDMPGSAFFSTWDFTVPDPCSSFSGLTCTSLGRVTALSLGPNLSGSLSPALSNLTHLTQLILYSGLVTGPLPPIPSDHFLNQKPLNRSYTRFFLISLQPPHS